MKGVVFVELLKMAEAEWGEDVVDDALDAVESQSNGVYIAVNKYPCEELVALVAYFSERSGVDAATLQRRLGHWIHGCFVANYPEFFQSKTCPLSLLESVESEIHVEVRKLHPDAELPTFATERPAPGVLQMRYSSPRALGSFCHGMIEACIDHYDRRAAIDVSMPLLPSDTVYDFEIRLE